MNVCPELRRKSLLDTEPRHQPITTKKLLRYTKFSVFTENVCQPSWKINPPSARSSEQIRSPRSDHHYVHACMVIIRWRNHTYYRFKHIFLCMIWDGFCWTLLKTANMCSRNIAVFLEFNSSFPTAEYMRRWIELTLVYIMACRLSVSIIPQGTNFNK